jgi:hypothetical protein
MAPEVQSPYFDTFGAKPAGKPFVTARMFCHAMHYLQNGQGFVGG